MTNRKPSRWPGPLVMLAVASLLAACDVNIGVEAAGVTARANNHFAVKGTPEVTLKTFDGTVEIRAWDRSEVSVDIEKRAADQATLAAIQVLTNQSGNTITIDAQYPNRPRNLVNIGFHISPSVRLVASVPAESNISVTSGDGRISIERVTGRLELNTGDGSIEGTGLGGNLRAHTEDGSVKLENLNGRADVETGDGGVRLSGRLQVLRVRTGDGSLSVRAEDGSTMADDWEIRTGDGGVSLELPGAFDADLDADTGDGHVQLQNVGLSSGDNTRQTVRGRIGAGGRTLRVRTNDGTITIRRAGS